MKDPKIQENAAPGGTCAAAGWKPASGSTVLGTGGLTRREELIARLDHVSLTEQKRIRTMLSCKHHHYQRYAGDLRCIYCGIPFTFPLSNASNEA